MSPSLPPFMSSGDCDIWGKLKVQGVDACLSGVCRRSDRSLAAAWRDTERGGDGPY